MSSITERQAADLCLLSTRKTLAQVDWSNYVWDNCVAILPIPSAGDVVYNTTVDALNTTANYPSTSPYSLEINWSYIKTPEATAAVSPSTDLKFPIKSGGKYKRFFSCGVYNFADIPDDTGFVSIALLQSMETFANALTFTYHRSTNKLTLSCYSVTTPTFTTNIAEFDVLTGVDLRRIGTFTFSYWFIRESETICSLAVWIPEVMAKPAVFKLPGNGVLPDGYSAYASFALFPYCKLYGQFSLADSELTEAQCIQMAVYCHRYWRDEDLSYIPAIKRYMPPFIFHKFTPTVTVNDVKQLPGF